MNFSFAPIAGWCLQSMAIGALAAACVAMCPATLRSRVRQAVPVAAFGALLILTACLFAPMQLDTVRQVHVSAPLAKAAEMNIEWVAWLWAAGCSLFLVQFLASSFSVWRLLRSTEPVPGRAWQQLLVECQEILGLKGRVRLRLAGPSFIPSAAGLLRRTVLLPDEALHWTREQRKLVLLHELGHFRRGDLWAHALGRLACALHWFNPFVWMLHRHLAVEREFACDALVLSRGASPDDYATLLFEMATASRRRPKLQAAFLTMASRRTGKLEARVMRILEPARKSGFLSRSVDALVCIVLGGMVVTCAALKPVANVWTKSEIQARLEADPFPE